MAALLLLTSEGTGEGLSWVKDIKYWDEDTVSYLEADKGRILFNSLKEVAGPVKRLGMELSSGMKINLGQDDIDLFRKNVKDAEIADISPDILRLRSIKSDTEIEKLKVGLFKSTICMEGVTIYNPREFERESLAKLPLVYVDYELGPLLRHRLYCSQIDVSVNEVTIVRNKDGEVNLSRLKAIASGKEEDSIPGQEQERKQIDMKIDKLRLTIKQVRFADYSENGEFSSG